MAFRIAIIGCGWVARFGHGPSCVRYAKNDPEVELVACCDKEQRVAEAFRQKFGFKRSYQDHRDLLKKEKIDALGLYVPETMVTPLAIEIMQKKIPLQLEKPPGVNARDTLAMIQKSTQMKVTHQVAWNRRFMPLVNRLIERLSPALQKNEVQAVHYKMYRHNRTELNFVYTAAHGIDLIPYLLGTGYDRLNLQYRDVLIKGKQVTNIYIQGNMKNGIQVSLHFQPAAQTVAENLEVTTMGHHYFLEMPVWDNTATKGALYDYSGNRRVDKMKQSDLPDKGEALYSFGFYQENCSFFKAIRKGIKSEHDLNSSLEAMRILDHIRARKNEYQPEE